jgi:hypothetical protein
MPCRWRSWWARSSTPAASSKWGAEVRASWRSSCATQAFMSMVWTRAAPRCAASSSRPERAAALRVAADAALAHHPVAAHLHDRAEAAVVEDPVLRHLLVDRPAPRQHDLALHPLGAQVRGDLHPHEADLQVRGLTPDVLAVLAARGVLARQHPDERDLLPRLGRLPGDPAGGAREDQGQEDREAAVGPGGQDPGASAHASII